MQNEQNNYDVVIKGNVVLPTEVLYDASLAVKDGKIVGIFKEDIKVRGKENIDAHGHYVLPGAIDAHVHCYSSLDEGFTTASRSAAAGGVTTIIEMPYDATGMVCTEELFLQKKERLDKETIVDMAMLATIQKKKGLDQIPLMAKAGACGFKVSMFNTDSFRFPRIDDGELYEAFHKFAETGCPVGVHAETDEIVQKFIEKYREEGDDPRSHCWSRPKISESTAALKVMEMAHWSGVKLHIYHCTFPHIFELVNYYRSKGTRVTAETCTHYLAFDENDMLSLKAKGKINPPLRSRNDREELWKQMSLGMIDIVTSDHAPWLIERKTHPNIFDNASGTPGVETLLPYLYSEGVAKGRITILQLAKLLSEKPASIFGLDYCKGTIEKGKDADFVIIDPKANWIIDEKNLHSSARWSPYHGMKMQGRITHTLVRGNVVYNGMVVGQPGEGKFVPAKHRVLESKCENLLV
ncbi:dihydroorotase family protein [Neobacillus sp. NPDC093182]|uniref:dihydroorotase n=1 Tax=Neobacillus sp. NPDC093182 TaxID=3364297 RepID=UPI003804D876